MDCSVKKTLIGKALASEVLPIASVDLDFMEEAHRMLLPSKMDLVAGARSRSSRRKPLTRLERPSPGCSRRLPLQRRVSRVTYSMRSSAWKHSDMGPMPRRWRSGSNLLRRKAKSKVHCESKAERVETCTSRTRSHTLKSLGFDEGSARGPILKRAARKEMAALVVALFAGRFRKPEASV